MINRIRQLLRDCPGGAIAQTLLFSPADYAMLEAPAEVELDHILGYRVEPHRYVPVGLVAVLDADGRFLGAITLDK